MGDYLTHFQALARKIDGATDPLRWDAMDPLYVFIAARMDALGYVDAVVEDGTVVAYDLTDEGRALLDDEEVAALRARIRRALDQIDVDDL